MCFIFCKWRAQRRQSALVGATAPALGGLATDLFKEHRAAHCRTRTSGDPTFPMTSGDPASPMPSSSARHRNGLSARSQLRSPLPRAIRQSWPRSSGLSLRARLAISFGFKKVCFFVTCTPGEELEEQMYDGAQCMYQVYAQRTKLNEQGERGEQGRQRGGGESTARFVPRTKTWTSEN
jgi:hypothetical protein